MTKLSASAEIQALPIEIGRARATQFIYLEEGEVIGSVLCKHERRRIAEMSWLFVKVEYRGRGIGRTLVCRCCEQATESKCETLALQIEADNRAFVEGFYRKLGFRPTFEWEDGDSSWTVAIPSAVLQRPRIQPLEPWPRR